MYAGDFNCQSAEWGYNLNNANGLTPKPGAVILGSVA